MSKYPFYMLMQGIIIAVILSCGHIKSMSSIENTPDEQESREGNLKPPCWMKTPRLYLKTDEDYEIYQQYLSRQFQGYPKDIPLSEAVTLFNREEFCNSTDKKIQKLTENEVMAGANDEMLKGGTEPIPRSFKITSPDRKIALTKIWKNKIMPKGSLLVAGGPYAQFDEKNPEAGTIKVDCRKIYLYLGLDKNPIDDQLMNPEQVCLIRKFCYGIELSSKP